MSYSERAVENDDIFENPKKYGCPTFEEYKRNREKYLGHYDMLGYIDKGSANLAKYVQKHKYEIEGYRFDKLEQVEAFAKDWNIPLQDFTAECIPQGGGKCDILVKFISSHERRRRDSW